MGETRDEVRTVVIGGAAGDGIREAGLHLADLLHAFGYEVFNAFNYPSLIRGGHNYARISYAKEKVWCDHKEIDVLIAVNEESVRLHLDELDRDATIFVEEMYVSNLADIARPIIGLPMKRIAEEFKAPLVARTSVALGAYGFATGISLDTMRGFCTKVFSDVGSEINVALMEKGYAHAEASGFSCAEHMRTNLTEVHGELIDGNKAVGKGFLAAGLEAYVGYPMTPSTSLLHFLARSEKDRHIKVVHPEDEIAVLNMALGISYAGKRVAVGTANGGFALMQETLSLAGIGELPIAILVSQRQGPATGVATHSSQGDLHFILHAGHGEFPRVVFAPGDAEECFSCAADALNLAWRYQTPVIVLVDKHLSESAQTSIIDYNKVLVDHGKLADHTEGVYSRYQITDDGISPMAFPGTPGAFIKATSYEHDEEGVASDRPVQVKAMHDKRFRKYNGLYQQFGSAATVKVFGDQNSHNVIVFWGSTKGAVLEASKYFDKPAKLVQVIWMEPFDADRVKAELKDAQMIVDIEANHTAQLAALIREKTSIEITQKILRYDAETFDPMELAAQINPLLV